MKPNSFLQSYLDHLADREDAWQDYDTNTVWTSRATLALVQAGPGDDDEFQPTAKGRPDRYGRSGPFTLDVCVCRHNWERPQFIAEHENSPYGEKIQYCAWKLVSVDASCRVLVAYFGGDSDLPTADALKDAVRDVCREQRGKEVLLVGAERRKVKSNEELRELHWCESLGLSM